MNEILFSPFQDRRSTKVSYGLEFSEACGKHVESTYQADRVYIIASASLARNTDALSRLKSSLGSRVAGVRIGMKPHTQWSEILEITSEARAVQADLLITLGAGTLTDAAKIVALAMSNNVATFDDLATLTFDSPTKIADMKAPLVPIVCIPTSLSGGEYSNFAGGSNDHTHRKHSFQGLTKGPSLIVLDAALSTTTPSSVWVSSGFRAVDHCVECLCSLQNKFEADKAAEEGLHLLVPGLLQSKRDGNNLEARHRCQLGVIEAMKGSGFGVPMGASHGIGHQLGPLGVGHGETSCILLPAVCKYNAEHKANIERQNKVLGILWQIPEVQKLALAGGLDVKTTDLGDILDVIIRELGQPRTLKAVGVTRDSIEALAANSLHDRWCTTNPVPLTKKGQIIEILEAVLE